MKCLKCEKELEFYPENSTNVNDGGDLWVEFHYGSRHDMCIGFSGRKIMYNDTNLGKLLAADRLKAYICDDCFEKNLHFIIKKSN
jgi:hypothetical protein